MEPISYCRAIEADMQALIDSRIAFLIELCGQPTTEELNSLIDGLEEYFVRALRNNTYLGYFAKVGNIVVGTGGMTVREHPGSFRNPSGIVGYIMNMYTQPEYRNRGIGSKIIRHLSQLAIEMNIPVLELHATKAGEPVYIKCGFEKHSEPTYRNFLTKQASTI